jgi:hypothetical protein
MLLYSSINYWLIIKCRKLFLLHLLGFNAITAFVALKKIDNNRCISLKYLNIENFSMTDIAGKVRFVFPEVGISISCNHFI